MTAGRLPSSFFELTDIVCVIRANIGLSDPKAGPNGDARIGAVAEHLTKPETMVYMVGMDAYLWECSVISPYQCTFLFDLAKELDIQVC